MLIAMAALKARQKANKKRVHVDNSLAHAGSPMYFYCPTCGGEIVVPEDYLTKPKHCHDCRDMIDKGWMIPTD